MGGRDQGYLEDLDKITHCLCIGGVGCDLVDLRSLGSLEEGEGPG